MYLLVHENNNNNNNRGILRDKGFHNLKDEDWDIVHRVHLNGSYSCTKAAWNAMRQQGFGRIIMTTSAAGIYGNAGQANYSAAKLAILGLANTLSIEGSSKNIYINTIAPVAGTRLTATVMPQNLVDALKTEYVAPLVLYLCHENSDVSGKLFELGAGWISTLRRVRTKGHAFSLNRTLTPEDIRDSWEKVGDFSDPVVPLSIQDSLMTMAQLLAKEQILTPLPTPNLRFDGKVVVVTGAGGGLGKNYALDFASRGAKVVVNDLGVDKHGKGGGANSPAQLVVDEIKKRGGEAVANFDSVENGASIIKTAIDTWGRVDVVINNAGILRDVTFQKIKDADFDLITRVHLKGSYSVSRAAWDIMRKQGYGRIIMTTSAAGIYGNFGQANYSAAKLGILGLANTLAIEGSRRNIFVNTIAPVAGTRLTASVLPPNLVESLKTEFISPLVLFLCHESSQVNGGLFEAGAGWISSVGWQRTKGNIFPVEDNLTLTPEDVRREWPKITDFSDPDYPKSAQESISLIINALEQAKKQEEEEEEEERKKEKGNEHVSPSKVIGYKFTPFTTTFNEKDVSLYALSVGAAKNPTDESELAFIYENHSEFKALPTFAITFPFKVLADIITTPGLKFNPMMLLHGEQYLEIKKPLPTSGTIISDAKIVGLYDKGSGVTVVIEATSRNEKDEEIAINRFTLFIRGIGGYGGDRGPAPEKNAPPQRSPDFVVEEKTDDNQALLYRLGSGDLNPIHADPAMASMGGFPKPILHGMCTYGYATRHILKQVCNNDPTMFKSISARMSKHVFPGETLITEMWKVSANKVIFQVKIKERNEIALANAVVILSNTPTVSPTAPLSHSSAPVNFKANPIFGEVKAAMNAEMVNKVKGIYQFVITDGPNGATKTFTVDAKNGNGTVLEDDKTVKPDIVITLSDDNCFDLFKGKLDPQQAFTSGKVRIKGNIALAMKLQVLMKAQPKL